MLYYNAAMLNTVRPIFYMFYSSFIFLITASANLHSQQSIAYYKQKFDKYLNLHHQLDHFIAFYSDKIVFKNKAGNEELTLFIEEIPTISKMLEAEKLETLEKFFTAKKNNLLPKRTRDSILISIDEIYSLNKKNHLPLSGIRIAIDPGHFAGDIKTAKIEQRLLYFTHYNNNQTDTIQLIEGQLTYLTATVLAEKLKTQGAEVMLTRARSNATAFGISFDEWYSKKRNKVLDSLLQTKQFTKDKYDKLKTCSKQQFLTLFFREYELLQRAKMINRFNPHITVIIHYNVDEKNNPWKKTSKNNYSMCFISGAFDANELEKTVNKIHFLRLLLTNQIENSEKISAFTIQHFENHLNVNPAKKNDANYLQNVCIPTEQKGVYCRNLLLTKYIISPLVYGESMCQDNYLECQMLSQNSYDFNGKKIPYRIYQVADSYYKAIIKYFQEIFSQEYSYQN